MQAPNQQRVFERLSSRHTDLLGSVQAAWARWSRDPGRSDLRFARTRASIVYDYFVSEAMARFDGRSDVRLIVRHESLLMLFDHEVLLRFKKGNAAGVGSNIETQRELDFVTPEAMIPGLLPDVSKVELCYQLDELKVDLKDISVVARDKDKRIWAYSISDLKGGQVLPFASPPGSDSGPSSSTAGGVLQFPGRSTAHRDEARDRPAVKPKQGADKKHEKDD